MTDMNICSQHLGLPGTKTISFTETTVVNPVPHDVLGNKHITRGGGGDVQPPELLNEESVGAEI